jgi:hypothetical protein
MSGNPCFKQYLLPNLYQISCLNVTFKKKKFYLNQITLIKIWILFVLFISEEFLLIERGVCIQKRDDANSFVRASKQFYLHIAWSLFALLDIV